MLAPNPPVRRALLPNQRSRGVMAALGPTNTGKTFLAIERMTAFASGMIGLPLRLLAREVYGRVVEKMGVDKVALITGEEKIKPPGARYFVCTVEAMPLDLDVEFVAIDEVQLCGDADRGHVFTDRLLNCRGRAETLLVGAATMRPLIERLMQGVNMVHRPRLSQLTFAGMKKITRLPRRSAIVAFSAEEVYAVAELIRRQNGGAAVVMGALSPRTRNAQVEMYQSGEVDYLVATDAIGMGLNLDLAHVAFASDRKFDGRRHRRLTPAEFGQIAGRAGRHMRDGTFGTSGRCPAFEPELADALQEHVFDPVTVLHWRNPILNFSSIEALQASLAVSPTEQGLTRAQAAEDMVTLDYLAREDDVRSVARGFAAVERLWDVCQLPDYRKVAPHHHAELASTIYGHLMHKGVLPEEWFSGQVAALDRMDGDIDSLSSRIAQIRTWTFAANRSDWLVDPHHWQGVTRLVEDRLSDALHERLASRFVDRRTSVLMRRLRENKMLEAIVSATGDVLVEGQHIGTLQGLRFTGDAAASGPQMKALNAAAARALSSEIDARAARMVLGGDDAFVLSNDGFLRWGGEPVARLVATEHVMNPQLRLLSDELLSTPAREQIEGKLANWLKAHLAKLLGTLQALESPADLAGPARGIAFQIAEALGVLERARVSSEVKALDQEARAALRHLGVRFGAYHLYVPALLKPAPRALAALLWSLKHGGPETNGLTEIVHLASSGRTSIPVDKDVPKALYRAGGFRVCGERAIRVDILERLADLVRPATNYRPGITPGEPPVGTADGDGFVVTSAMTSLVGCSGADFSSVLRSLGYVSQMRPGPAITVPLVALAAVVPAAEVIADPIADEAVQVATEVATEVATDENHLAAEAVTGASDTAMEQPAQAETDAAMNEAAVVATQEPDQTLGQETAEGGAHVDAPVEAIAEAHDDADEPVAAPELVVAAEIVVAADIEVWRQHRVQHGENRRQQRHSRPQHARPPIHDGVAVATTEGAEGAEKPPRERQGRRDRPEWKVQDQRQGRTDGAEPRGDRPAHQPGPRRDDRNRPGRNDERKGNFRDGGKSGSNRDGQKQWSSAPPPRNERLPDPNSPFAKLLALKAELEGRGKS